MNSFRHLLIVCAAVATALLTFSSVAAAVDASAPRQVTLQVYDIGLTLVGELRSITAQAGESDVFVRQLPTQLDPASVSVTPTAGGALLDVLEQRFEYDLSDANRLLRRYLGRTLSVGSSSNAREGRLVGLPAWREPPFPSKPLVLAQPDGALVSFYSPLDAGRIAFPGAAKVIYDEPTLVWRARIPAEGMQTIRLGYVMDGLSWQAVYDVVLEPGARLARLSGRIGLQNMSGGSFSNATVVLLETERGRLGGDPENPAEIFPSRYSYGSPQPRDERTIASLIPLQTHSLGQKVTLGDGDSVFLPLASVAQLPVSRVYVYDGVRFDRFQRNRRNDWSYGTEYHTTVDTYLEFENKENVGLGLNLPPGRLSLFQRADDDSVELLGSDTLSAVQSGASGQLRVGPARGLRGERERTGYAEVRPLHEYEESFEIRLFNDSDQTAAIRVVEHLYRWPEFEIVKADADYQSTGPQSIEFQVELKAGGRKTIHYTVRYRW
ncbi:MAG: hypothetical protein M9963_00340 [Kiritimatiellae bacterium]|nr:hypothetical protein [Kiritimatiellia bacterium]MCO5068045.1 hypothetical protein [Kiritimatiellia bacterium]